LNKDTERKGLLIREGHASNSYILGTRAESKAPTKRPFPNRAVLFFHEETPVLKKIKNQNGFSSSSGSTHKMELGIKVWVQFFFTQK
jgi:hypothetical protein